MKKLLISSILLIFTLITGVIYGIVIYKYNVFPYRFIKRAYSSINQKNNYGPWSIGIFKGTTPFNLSSTKDISNPVLTAKDVVDIDAYYVADPFMVFDNGKYFMFFEVVNRKNNQGDIAYAESRNLRDWTYKKVVIDENFHLSFPYVFKWKNNYYLIPESNKDFSVRLYKATEFPKKWKYVGKLLSGYQYVDSSIFRYKDMWWMFVSVVGDNVLNLYFSENLLNGWKPHPNNPIVKSNRNFSRPGGRVIKYKDKLFRLTQDDEPIYGLQVFAFEITELSKTSYMDKLVSEKPLVTKTGKGWNAAGMHHVDLHKIGNKWVAAVDGRCW